MNPKSEISVYDHVVKLSQCVNVDEWHLY